MRNSLQRNLVYDIVMSSCDHPTAETIHLRAKNLMPKISLGTVYRNLNELVELNKVLRITVPGDSDRFDKTLYPHAHLFCTCCLNLLDLQEPNLLDWINQLEKNNQAKILSSDISFHGICSSCQQNKGEEL